MWTRCFRLLRTQQQRWYRQSPLGRARTAASIYVPLLKSLELCSKNARPTCNVHKVECGLWIEDKSSTSYTHVLDIHQPKFISVAPLQMRFGKKLWETHKILRYRYKHCHNTAVARQQQRRGASSTGSKTDRLQLLNDGWNLKGKSTLKGVLQVSYSYYRGTQQQSGANLMNMTALPNYRV